MSGGELLFLSEPTTPKGAVHLCEVLGAKLLAKCFLFFTKEGCGMGTRLASLGLLLCDKLVTASLKLSTGNLAILGLEMGLSFIVNTPGVLAAHGFTSFLNPTLDLSLAVLCGSLLLDEGPLTGMFIPSANTGDSWLVAFHAELPVLPALNLVP